MVQLVDLEDDPPSKPTPASQMEKIQIHEFPSFRAKSHAEGTNHHTTVHCEEHLTFWGAPKSHQADGMLMPFWIEAEIMTQKWLWQQAAAFLVHVEWNYESWFELKSTAFSTPKKLSEWCLFCLEDFGEHLCDTVLRDIMKHQTSWVDITLSHRFLAGGSPESPSPWDLGSDPVFSWPASIQQSSLKNVSGRRLSMPHGVMLNIHR